MFILDMRVKVQVNAYNDGTTAGRIYVEFPTNGAFATDLGTGLSTGNLIPCSFNNLGANAYCILRKAEVANTPAVVEVINFD